MSDKEVAVPTDFPVQPLGPEDPCVTRATCGTCQLSWDDGKSTSYTPAPGGRCPFEAFHLAESPHVFKHQYNYHGEHRIVWESQREGVFAGMWAPYTTLATLTLGSKTYVVATDYGHLPHPNTLYSLTTEHVVPDSSQVYIDRDGKDHREECEKEDTEFVAAGGPKELTHASFNHDIVHAATNGALPATLRKHTGSEIDDPVCPCHPDHHSDGEG